MNKAGKPIAGLYTVGNDVAGVLRGDTYEPNTRRTEIEFVFYSGKHAANIISEQINV